ncbi:hypothetical protein [Deinococcus koreensis]|uniref:hypothetical protein n=1 Tax=Deinococcus koreensis TaxID=2054903 RepID=UPI0013FDB972|nr:hypothetical protein [Deinococcus koreensis]
MTAVLILMVIFGGIALITYVDNVTKAQKRAGQLPPPPASALPGTPAHALAAPAPEAAQGAGVEALILCLPEPARNDAWTLLCSVADAQREGQPDTRTAYLLAQTREAYLPDTLRAYFNLTEGARRTLSAQGQPPELLLGEQLRLMDDGVREALRHDHATADRLLSQGRFLRERFGPVTSGAGGSELALPDGPARSEL